MAIFKCKVSGNTVEFKEQHDIDQMRKHPEYEEVVVVEKTTPVKKQQEKKAE